MQTPAIGVDVGGSKKGYHAVALSGNRFEPRHFSEAEALAAWCLDQEARVIGIDAPCGWANTGGSRLAERSLALDGQRIQCFKTPTRAAAAGIAFYEWVFNGERLYRRLDAGYQRFDGTKCEGKIMFETFPHAVVCALTGRLVPAKDKSVTRRRVLQKLGYDDSRLTSIDFVDAALCAVTAERFHHGMIDFFGDREEGFIVVPKRAVDFA